VADGLELGGVVTRDPRRRAELGRDYPGVPVYDSQHALLDAGVDIVTITTPPRTRRELVLEAIAAGVRVVADKPFAPDAPAARELAEAAQSAGVVLTVFHNRRWDADIRTLRATLARPERAQPKDVSSRSMPYRSRPRQQRPPYSIDPTPL
jgi:predicted dehydrogenase